MPLSQNKIKFGHNGSQMSYWWTWWKRYDGANIPRWNLEVEPFITQWVTQMEEYMHGLGVVKDHMLPWGIIVDSC
jgi:hypothetical protein